MTQTHTERHRQAETYAQIHTQRYSHIQRDTHTDRDTNTHRLTHILARHPSERELRVRPDTSCPPSPVSQPGKPSAERADLRVRSVAGLGLAPRVSSSLSGSSRSQPAGNLAVKDQAEPPRPRPPLPSPRPHLQAFPSGAATPSPSRAHPGSTTPDRQQALPLALLEGQALPFADPCAPPSQTWASMESWRPG